MNIRIKGITHAARATIIDFLEVGDVGDVLDKSLSIIFDNQNQGFYFDSEYNDEQIKEILVKASEYMIGRKR